MANLLEKYSIELYFNETETSIKKEEEQTPIEEEKNVPIEEEDEEYKKLKKLKVPELKQLCKSKKIRGFSKLKKQELIDLLRGKNPKEEVVETKIDNDMENMGIECSYFSDDGELVDITPEKLNEIVYPYGILYLRSGKTVIEFKNSGGFPLKMLLDCILTVEKKERAHKKDKFNYTFLDCMREKGRVRYTLRWGS